MIRALASLIALLGMVSTADAESVGAHVVPISREAARGYMRYTRHLSHTTNGAARALSMTLRENGPLGTLAKPHIDLARVLEPLAFLHTYAGMPAYPQRPSKSLRFMTRRLITLLGVPSMALLHASQERLDDALSAYDKGAFR